VKSKRIFAPRIISDHIMVQEDFERQHKFLLETEGLSEVSDEMRELVEEETEVSTPNLTPITEEAAATLHGSESIREQSSALAAAITTSLV
jgi:hypothetical protein